MPGTSTVARFCTESYGVKVELYMIALSPQGAMKHKTAGGEDGTKDPGYLFLAVEGVYWISNDTRKRINYKGFCINFAPPPSPKRSDRSSFRNQ